MNFIALGFRLASGGARFLFVIYLARFATPDLVGAFGLAATLTILFTQLAGLELNQVMGRRLHAHPWPVVRTDLARQLRLMLLAHLALVVAFVAAYGGDFGGLAPVIGLILVLEHLITEVYRVLILLMRTALASFILFAKNVTWMLLYVIAVHTLKLEQSLALLALIWLGTLVAVGMAILAALHRIGFLREILTSPLDVPASLSMMKEATPFIASAIAIGLAGTFDRLIIEASFSTSEFGVYFFYFTYASAISLLVTFTIGATVGPRCIKAYASGDDAVYRVERRRAGRLYAAVSAITAMALILAARPLITFLKGDEYLAHLPALYFVVLSQAVLVNFDPLKMDLYLARADGALMISNIFYLVMLMIAVVTLSFERDLAVVAAGVLVATILGLGFFQWRLGLPISARFARWRSRS